jgi:hypothetical protein
MYPVNSGFIHTLYGTRVISVFLTLTGYSESTFLAQHCTAKANDKARIHRRLLVQHLKIEIKNEFVYIQLSMGRK